MKLRLRLLVPAHVAAGFLVAPLVVAVLLAGVPLAVHGSDQRVTPTVLAVAGAVPSVVNIRAEKRLAVSGASSGSAPGAKDSGRLVNGMGTGVVIDPRGYIVTNQHVVEGVLVIKVSLSDNTQHVARLVAHDPRTDLALIKIDPPEPLPVIPLGTSSDLMMAETVIAIGNAFGYAHSTTKGIISALNREVQVSDAQFYEDLIQTDASINPGNSGGPLLNIDGEMIGINVAVRAGADGIGFAIPVDKAMDVVSQLFAEMVSQRVWHGVVFNTHGVSRVAEVEPGSPAAEAGLRAGDVIVKMDGAVIDRPLEFQQALLDETAGEEVKLSVRRGEQSLTVPLHLAVSLAVQQATIVWEQFGLDLQELPSAGFRHRFPTTELHGGLLIRAVRASSPAARYGIQQGDVLVGLGRWETLRVADIFAILEQPKVRELPGIQYTSLRGVVEKTRLGQFPVFDTRIGSRNGGQRPAEPHRASAEPSNNTQYAARSHHQTMVEPSASEQIDPIAPSEKQSAGNSAWRTATSKSNQADQAMLLWERYGLDLVSMPSADFRRRFPTTSYEGGLRVRSVRPDSPAYVQGIRANDVMTGLHKWKTLSIKHILLVLEHPETRQWSRIGFCWLTAGEVRHEGVLSVFDAS